MEDKGAQGGSQKVTQRKEGKSIKDVSRASSHHLQLGPIPCEPLVDGVKQMLTNLQNRSKILPTGYFYKF